MAYQFCWGGHSVQKQAEEQSEHRAEHVDVVGAVVIEDVVTQGTKLLYQVHAAHVRQMPAYVVYQGHYYRSN